MEDAGPSDDVSIPGTEVDVPKPSKLLFVIVGKVSAKLVGPIDAAGIWPGGDDMEDAGPSDDVGIPGTEVDVPKPPKLLSVDVGKVSAKLVGAGDAVGAKGLALIVGLALPSDIPGTDVVDPNPSKPLRLLSVVVGKLSAKLVGAGDAVGAKGLTLIVGLALPSDIPGTDVVDPNPSKPLRLLSVVVGKVSAKLVGAGDAVGADGFALNVGIALPGSIPVAFKPPDATEPSSVPGIGDVILLEGPEVKEVELKFPPVLTSELFMPPPKLTLLLLLMVVLLLLSSKVIPHDDAWGVGVCDASFHSPSDDVGASPGHNGTSPPVAPSLPPSPSPPPPSSESTLS